MFKSFQVRAECVRRRANTVAIILGIISLPSLSLPHVNGGQSGCYSVRKPRSKDPHRREWKFVYKFLLRLIRLFSGCTLIYYTAFPDMDKDKIFPHAVIWI